MAAALLSQLEAAAGTRLVLLPRPAPEAIPGLPAAGGFPRGCLSEICGPASSGRTSITASLMAALTAREEACALVDTSDSFDPASAAAAGVCLDRLLWVRCGGDAERALKVLDLLVQGGGFGLVVFDLGDVPPRTARRISLTSWFRLRRAVENTPTALVVVEQEPHAKTCASLVLETARGGAAWSGTPGCSRLLRELRVSVQRRKPSGPAGVKHVCLHSRLG